MTSDLMEYAFLKTEAEGYALYASVLCYFAAIIIALTRYLKITRSKKLNDKTAKAKKRKVYLLAIACLLICALIHTFLFLLFVELIPDHLNPGSIPRTSYYVSILLTLVVFSFFMWFGMYLRGTSTLPKQQGPVSGV